MDLVILKKIEFSILNGLGYIGRLEKKNGSKKYCEQYFLRFPHLSRCEAPQNKWMETLLQGRKADATNRSVGFSDSLMGIVPPSMGDRCICIGHFRDEAKLSPKN